MDFKDKVVLITGASSGIGAATAEHFAKMGASLALTGRNEVKLNEVAHICAQNANIPKPLTIIGDVTIEKDVQRILETTLQHFGKLHVLVNNAGIVAKGSIETATLEDFDCVMSANVRSIFQLTKLAVPHLISSKGNIVNVSSVNGIRSFPGVLVYNMSKSAVDQFTRCTALELASKGVRVNSVNPGVIVTDIHKRGGMTNAEYENFLEHSKSTHALGRVGNVDEVASAITYLASESASFITGIQLAIDGGRHNMDFTGKIVLITGASSGIGAATAEYLSSMGAYVALVGRNEDNLNEVSLKCGENTFVIVADLTIEDDVNRIIESTIDHYGQLDVLVNCAGSIAYNSLENSSLDEFDSMINTNLRSIFLLTKLAIPHLIDTKGSIVNVSSVLGLRSFPNVFAYSLSKAAVNQFTQCLALELAPKGVRVNAVVPGVILTNLQRRAGMEEEAYQDYLERSAQGHALGRVGDASEVAAAIAFLASDLASFSTGVLLPVDGGKHAMCPR